MGTICKECGNSYERVKKREGAKKGEKARIRSEWVERQSGKYIERKWREGEVRIVEEEMKEEELVWWFGKLRSAHTVVY